MKTSDKVQFYLDADLVIGEIVSLNLETADVMTYMGLVQGIPLTELFYPSKAYDFFDIDLKEIEVGHVFKNRYSGLLAEVLKIENETNTILLRLSGGQEAEYDLDSIEDLWYIKQ